MWETILIVPTPTSPEIKELFNALGYSRKYIIDVENKEYLVSIEEENEEIVQHMVETEEEIRKNHNNEEDGADYVNPHMKDRDMEANIIEKVLLAPLMNTSAGDLGENPTKYDNEYESEIIRKVLIAPLLNTSRGVDYYHLDPSKEARHYIL